MYRDAILCVSKKRLKKVLNWSKQPQIQFTGTVNNPLILNRWKAHIGKMDKDRVDDIFEDPNMIFGIHNYCDRWCERCPKTARCSVFAMTESENTDPQTRDAENEAFWDRLQETFDLTLEMACDWMDENDIEIEEAG